jgi:hypothetical protein
MLRQTPEEDGYLYDLEFVTDPPTPYQYPQSTHEWAIQDAGFRGFTWHPSKNASEATHNRYLSQQVT